jgi:DNA-binding protein Fis
MRPRDLYQPSLEEESVRIVRRFFLEQRREGIYKQILELVERPLIEMILAETGGNQKLAAQRLGINRNTLHSRIKKLRIDADKYRAV